MHESNDQPRAEGDSRADRRDAPPAADELLETSATTDGHRLTTPEPPGLDISHGARIGHYEIIRMVGQGGASRVFLSRDLKLGRLVALKFVPLALGGDTQSFLREARATAQLNHEHIVTLYEVNEYQNVPYMALEYIKGESLAAWHKEYRRRASGADTVGVSPYRAVELMKPVVKALVYAHEAGIIHRDLKPQNIMLADRGGTKVLDFGLVEALSHRAADPTNAVVLDDHARGAGSGAEPDRPRQVAGTLPYMSPEQLLADPLDERTDLWSVGIVLFELLTGKHPLAPVSVQTSHQIVDLQTPMPSIAGACGGLGRLGALVDRCLAKPRQLRPQSAQELLAELEASVASAARARPEQANPYLGLAAFAESDADRYFGREEEVQQATRRLDKEVMLTVAGPSGAGKSSFVRAGVIASLKRSGEHWAAYWLRPGRHPLHSLAELFDIEGNLRGLTETGPRSHTGTSDQRSWLLESRGITQDEPDLDTRVQRMRDQPGLLAQKLRERAVAKHSRILLVVDQFEELYTLASPADRAAFVRALEAVADDVASPLRLVLSIRADYLDRVDAGAEGFGQRAVNSVLWLNEMGPDRLRSTLEGPLAGTGVRFEADAMVESIVQELGGSRGALPLLQFTAAKLWEERDGTRLLLRTQTLEQLGGVAGTLASHADEVIASMSELQVESAREVLTCLVTPERTRAVVPLSELLELHVGREQALRLTVAKLVASRLVVAHGKGRGAHGARLELVHESLVRRWPRLAAWLDESDVDARLVQRLRTAATEWHRGGRTPGLLWTGEAAAEARLWKQSTEDNTSLSTASPSLTEVEREYLEAVLREAARTTRRRRQIITTAGVILVAVGLVLSYLTKIAREQSVRAERQAIEARNMARMAASEKWIDNPTVRLALLRDMEGAVPPPGWQETVRETLSQPIPPLVLRGHTGMVYSVAYSPDAKHLVSASADGTVRVWQADGHGEPVILEGHTGEVNHASFSPDGRHIVSASDDETVRIWRADGPGEPRVLRGHTGIAKSAMFSPDGRHVVSTSYDKTVRVWRADGQGEPRILEGHTGIVYFAAFSPDGQHIVSASDDQTVRIWPADGEGQPQVLEGHLGIVGSVAYSPDGRHIVSASGDKTVRIWPADGQGSPVVLLGHADVDRFAVFSPDGRHIVSASYDKTLRIWPSDGQGAPRVLEGHTGRACSVAYSPDGRHIVSASHDETLRVWRADDRAEPLVLNADLGPGCATAYSPDGEHVVSAAGDNSLRTWRADAPSEPLVLKGHLAAGSAATYSPDGQHIVSASADRTLRVWRADGLGEPRVLAGHASLVRAVAYSPDGLNIASASDDRTVRIWPADGPGEPRVLEGHAGWVMSVAYSPDGKHVVSASYDETVRVWPADGQGDPLVLEGHAGFVRRATYSPDGQHIASASDDQTVRIWRADGRGDAQVFSGHTGPVLSVAYSPDGQHLVSGSVDKTVRVWPVDRRAPPLVLEGHAGPVASVRYSPDGTLIVSSSYDDTMRIWPANGEGPPLVLKGHTATVQSAEYSPDGRHIVSAARDATVRVWSDFTVLDLEHPRIWGVTNFCLTLDEYREELGFTDELATRSRQRCLDRVAAHAP